VESRNPEHAEHYFALGMNRWFMLETPLTYDPTVLAQALLKSPFILSVQDEQFVHTELVPNDFSLNNMWGLTKMHCPQAWDLKHGNSDIIITTIDTGCKITHPDLAANMFANPLEDLNQNGIYDSSDINFLDDDLNGYVDDVVGFDFVSFVPDSSRHAVGEEYGPEDPFIYPDIHGHGTHVMGTAAGVTHNGLGVAAASWNVRAMPLRAGYAWVNTAGVLQGSGSDEDFASAVQYAADNGARVISISVGGTGYDAIFDMACTYAKNLGVMIFASAGNSNNQTIQYPANYDGVIAVAATDSFDVKASFSTYGTWVNLSAPGVYIWSTISNSSYRPGDYQAFNGTSMASPNAAAVAALCLSFYPEIVRDSLEAIILRTADNIDAQNPTKIGLLGTGRVNADRALQDACATHALNHPIVVARSVGSNVSLHWPRIGCAVDYEILGAGTVDGIYSPVSTTSDTFFVESPALAQKFYQVIAR
jgi:subtilisin family serine protease